MWIILVGPELLALRNFVFPLGDLLGIPPALLAVALTRKCTFDSQLFARLQIVGIFLHFLDNVLLLDLSFEAAKGVFERFTFLYPYFRHSLHPLTV